MKLNPWKDRFRGLDRDAIWNRFEYRPQVVGLPGSMGRDEFSAKLKKALSRMAVATDGRVDICEVIVAHAIRHACMSYHDANEFRHQINQKSGPDRHQEIFPLLLTGPAGIGKSVLVQAMTRVFPKDTAILHGDKGNSHFPLRAALYLNAAETRTPRQILEKLIHDCGQVPSGKNTADLHRQCRRLVYLIGVCVIIVDELQFLTKSSEATANIMGVVYELANLGVPVVTVANFSLLERLLGRPPQDRQRVLSNIMVLNHETAVSPGWLRIVEAFKAVAPEVFLFNPKDDAKTLHGWVAGTPRTLAKLLEIAVHGKRKFPLTVTMADLEKAYESIAFAVFRKDVELMNLQFATGQEARKDLWCPIQLPVEESAALAVQAGENLLEETLKEMLWNSLTPEDRKLYEILQSQAPGEESPDNVVPMKRGKQYDIDDFSAGEDIYKKLK